MGRMMVVDAQSHEKQSGTIIYLEDVRRKSDVGTASALGEKEKPIFRNAVGRHSRIDRRQ
ncbi:MAG: hypothetical protein CMM48_01925 [Rhodospirillaceae bacterium]|nr:hypothetical protein [Rhodospirillaceae bacterium]